jgi:DNA-binding beta-propeller fold protein YncE
MSMRALLSASVAAVVLASAAGGASRPHLRLPYDLAARGSTVYVADGLRHQILRFNLKRRQLAVVAGTGRTGTSGDGGPARRARLTEPAELTLDPVGNLYFSDVNQGRVRRIDRRGIISTVARVPAAAGVAVDPSGRYLAVSSIEGFVYRVELATGARKRLAGDGKPASSGDGGPAAAAQLNGPHDVTYEPNGDLLITEAAGVRRIDAQTGRMSTAFSRPAFKVAVGPNGTYFLISGDPSGGRITQVNASGAVLRVIGTGRLSRHVPRAPIGRVGFLPSDVEPVGGALLIAETRPVAAVRRLAPGSSTLTTFLR